MKQRILTWKSGQGLTLKAYLEQLSLQGTIHSVIKTSELEISVASGRQITIKEAIIITFPFEQDL